MCIRRQLAAYNKKFLPAASTLMFVWYSSFNVGGIGSGVGARLSYSRSFEGSMVMIMSTLKSSTQSLQ
jgi:hypothetical protein